jgi:signal transduction protein with GAF and PtsI domain
LTAFPEFSGAVHPAATVVLDWVWKIDNFAVKAPAAPPESSGAERLKLLQGVTDTNLAHLSVESLLDELLTRVQNLLQVDTAVVLLLDSSGQFLHATAARGLEEEVRQGVRIPVGQGFAGRIAEQKAPVALDHVDDSNVLNPILLDKGIASMLGVPLIVAGRVIGVLHVGCLRSRRFTEPETSLLQTVADRLGLAVQAAPPASNATRPT